MLFSFFLFILILWIACPLLSAIVASKNGHSGATWFFLGILFGPLALMATFCIGENNGRRRQGEILEEMRLQRALLEEEGYRRRREEKRKIKMQKMEQARAPLPPPPPPPPRLG